MNVNEKCWTYEEYLFYAKIGEQVVYPLNTLEHTINFICKMLFSFSCCRVIYTQPHEAYTYSNVAIKFLTLNEAKRILKLSKL
jgi:hypothetical protein